MSSINFPRHFISLLLAAVLLSFSFDSIASAIPVDRFHFYFGFIGLLYASAWVIALRSAQSLKRRLAFVCIATALSIGAPYFAVLFGTVVNLMNVTNNDFGLFSLYGAGSAVGAFAFWMVMRAFWLRNLTFLSLVRSVGFCIVATLLSLVVAGEITGFGSHPNALSGDLPTYFWWVAFSSSLFYGEMRLARLQTTVEKRGAQPQMVIPTGNRIDDPN
jgi:hypothetical protein